MATTPQPPVTVNELINKLKNLPLHWKIQIANETGIYYITDIGQIDDCTAELVLEKVPPLGEIIIDDTPEE